VPDISPQRGVNQTSGDKLEMITNDPVGIIKAGYPTNYDRDIQVVSVQSLTRRLNHCPEFDLIIVDEAHHSTANSYRTILNRFPAAKVLGVTATPIRLDGNRSWLGIETPEKFRK
jgi:superfamily II DNA or RNA helicase